MKKFNLNQNTLSVGIALALGMTFSGSASASTGIGNTNATGTGVQISNTATATYSVDGQAQTPVSSNAVTVNVNEVASFTLVANQGTDASDDKNENQVATPDKTTNFTNILTNTGNMTDTYVLTLKQNNDPTIDTGTKDFYFTNPTTINYTIKNSDGTTASTGTVNSGDTNTPITLTPGQYALINYDLKTPAGALNGQSGIGTLEATSTYIKAKDATKATLINENQAKVALPVFSIVKTAANNIDLNTATDITYTIKIKNDGAVDATNILVQDSLDPSISLTDTTTTNIKVTGIADTTYSTTGSASNLLKVSGIDLKVGETATITFKVTIADKATLATKGSLVNNADVYDNYDSTNPDPSNPQIWDSTDPTKTDTPHVPDSSDPDNTNPDTPAPGGDSPSTITFTQRALTLTNPQYGEVPTTSTANSNADYAPVIKNTGKNTEGDTAGELTFKLTDATTGNNVAVTRPVTITYDPTPNSPNSGDEKVGLPITPDANGVYDINTALPAGVAPGGTVTINYSVDSTSAVVGTVDKVNVTLIPGGVNPPAEPTAGAYTVTDTTTVKGMTLLKEQALDASCDGTIGGTFTNPDGTQTPEVNFTSSNTPMDAKPGQCVIYRITATNNFTSLSNIALSNVVISDKADQWNTKATYITSKPAFVITDSVSAGGSKTGNVTAPGDYALSSNLNIPAGGTGTLQFGVKINQ